MTSIEEANARIDALDRERTDILEQAWRLKERLDAIRIERDEARRDLRKASIAAWLEQDRINRPTPERGWEEVGETWRAVVTCRGLSPAGSILLWRAHLAYGASSVRMEKDSIPKRAAFYAEAVAKLRLNEVEIPVEKP